MTAGRTERRKAERKGRFAELLAAVFLVAQGYSVIARRYKTPAGEIDLVIRRGNIMAFVEVKARRDIDAAIEAVSITSRKRIARAAALFFTRHTDLAQLDVRYDIIAVAGFRVRYVKDAWRDGDY